MDLKSDEKEETLKHYIAVTPQEYQNRQRIIQDTFKGEVDDKQTMFPRGLGAVHPFDFSQIDLILQNVGIMDALTDKIVDAVIGDFSINADNANAQAFLDTFIDETSFDAKIRPWIKEGIGKGNGFMELDLKDIKNIDKIRVMNSTNMYVKRNKKGKVMEFNQFKGQLRSFLSSKEKVISFKPAEIAHLTINKIPNDPYGRGLIYSNRVAIEHYAGSELDLHKLLGRKAGAPIHVKLGQPGEAVRPGDLDAYKEKLQYMTNSTEWVTDGNTEMTLIDFKGIGDNLIKAAEHDLEQIALGMKIPMSLVGVGNNPEGLAKVNLKGFDRFINSVRVVIQEVVEKQILKPLLQANNLDAKIDFTWDLPGEEEKNERLAKITEALKIIDLSPELRAALEIQYAEILELEVVGLLPTPVDARKKADEEEKELKKEIDLQRKAEETKIKQPEVPGSKTAVKKVVKQSAVTHEHKKVELTETEKANMTLQEYANLKEIPGFNYSDFLVSILTTLRTDKFDNLRALTELDLAEGLLPARDISKLRVIIKDGFRKNRTIRQIENEIKRTIPLRDRFKIDENGEKTLTLSASERPINIARTETVRLANEGLKKVYKDNQILRYRWLAALDERTCPECMALDGQVFVTNEGESGVSMPPAHPMCRCSMVGLID